MSSWLKETAMKILYISQYFTPEICAPAYRAHANVAYLSDQGHEVTVLAEIPNHPKGIIFPEYRGKLFVTDRLDNFVVHRVWVFTSKKKTFVTRILFYASFMFLGTLRSLLGWRKHDVVYVSSPPLFVAVIGIVLKRMFPKVKLVFEVRDLWPDVAISIGELKNRRLIALSRKIEETMYRLSDKIVVVTAYFKETIIGKGFPSDKIVVIRNGSDLDTGEGKSPEDRGDLNLELNPEGWFSVIYAGNFGLAQNLGTILRAAEELKEENIHFYLIGGGPEEKELREKASDRGLSKVRFLDEVPKDEIHRYLDIADCGIVPLRKTQMFTGTIPSKMFDYMACNLPVLLGVEGEAREILDDAKTGIGFEPDNHVDLAEKIMWLKNNPDTMRDMASRGRKFVLEHFTREKQASLVEKELLSLTGRGG